MMDGEVLGPDFDELMGADGLTDPNVARPTRVRKSKANFVDGVDTGYDSGSNFGSAASNPKKKKKRGPKPRLEDSRGLEADTAYGQAMKRPRGRPPLAGKKNAAFPPLGPPIFHHATPSAAPTFYRPPPGVKMEQESAVTPSASSTKYPRPLYQSVVNKVIAKLMTVDPISLNDLSRRLVECPRDMVHAVLEVLQVLGLVTQFKAKEGLRPEYQSGTVVYTFLDFAKVPEAIPLEKIADDIADQLESQRKCILRMIAIQNLAEEDLPPAEKADALRKLIESFIQDEPHLEEDPLYIQILSGLNKNSAPQL